MKKLIIVVIGLSLVLFLIGWKPNKTVNEDFSVLPIFKEVALKCEDFGNNIGDEFTSYIDEFKSSWRETDESYLNGDDSRISTIWDKIVSIVVLIVNMLIFVFKFIYEIVRLILDILMILVNGARNIWVTQ